MNDEDLKKLTESLKAAEELLKSVKLPGKKDSMLKAAKIRHIEDIGNILNTLLEEYMIDQREEIVEKFKEAYSQNVLKFIQGK